MARTLIFVAEFTKSKVKTTPANAPTIDIADMLAPTASLLVSGGSPTQLTNMTGVYIYSYSAADSVLPVAVMRTADTTVDLQDVPCLPLPFDASGFVKSAPQTDSSGITTLLSRIIGTLAAGTHNAQSGDAYALLPAQPAAIGDAMTLTSGERNSIADAILKRDWTAVTGEASRSILNALRFLRNKWSLSGTTLHVTKEDDSTDAWTASVTTSSSADPITGADPD